MPTFNANVLPSSTGFDLGSAAQRWDAFLQQMNVSGAMTLTGALTVGTWNNVRIVDGAQFTTIQAAIDDLPVGGGTVMDRREGAQTLLATINVNKPVWLIGPGVAATLTLANSVNGDIFDITVNDVLIEGFVLDGNRANQTAGIGIDVVSADRVTLRNNTIQNTFDKGIRGTTSSDLLIENNRLTNTGLSGANDAAIYYFQSAAVTDSGLRIVGNTIDSSASNTGGIKIAANIASAILNDVETAHNTVIVGDAGATDTLGIEYFTSNGGLIRGAGVEGNKVRGENATNTNIFGISLGGSGAGGVDVVTVNSNVCRDTRKISYELIASNVSGSSNVAFNSGHVVVSDGGTANNLQNIQFSASLYGSVGAASEAVGVLMAASTVTNLDFSGMNIYDPEGAGVSIVSGTVNGLTMRPVTIWKGGASGFIAFSGTTVTGANIELIADLSDSVGADDDGVSIATANFSGIISSSLIRNASRHGYFYNAAVTDLVLTDSTATGCGSDGVRTTGGSNLTFTNNYMYSNGGTGFILAGTPTNVTYHGNKARNNTTADENLGAATFSANSTSILDTLRVLSDLDHDGSNVGFFAVTPAARPGATDDIKDALTTLGLLQGTSATPLDLDGGEVLVGRYKAEGTSLVAGDFSLSAGWGTTASVSAVSGTDQRFRITVTSAGTGQGANPTITLTFKDGTWTTAPFAVAHRGGGSQPTVSLDVTSTTATTLVATFNGTPVAAETYDINCIVMG